MASISATSSGRADRSIGAHSICGPGSTMVEGASPAGLSFMTGLAGFRYSCRFLGLPGVQFSSTRLLARPSSEAALRTVVMVALACLCSNFYHLVGMRCLYGGSSKFWSHQSQAARKNRRMNQTQICIAHSHGIWGYCGTLDGQIATCCGGSPSSSCGTSAIPCLTRADNRLMSASR